MAKKKQDCGLATLIRGDAEEYIKKHAPSLLPVYLTLRPFDYLFHSKLAGPQKNTRDYDPDEPEYIELGIDDPRYQGGETEGVSLHCRITATAITMLWHCVDGADGKDYDDASEITLEGLWDYLRQLPKPYECFCKEGR